MTWKNKGDGNMEDNITEYMEIQRGKLCSHLSGEKIIMTRKKLIWKDEDIFRNTRRNTD